MAQPPFRTRTISRDEAPRPEEQAPRPDEGARHGLGDRAPLLAPARARATTTAGARSSRRPPRSGCRPRRRSSRSASSRSSPATTRPTSASTSRSTRTAAASTAASTASRGRRTATSNLSPGPRLRDPDHRQGQRRRAAARGASRAAATSRAAINIGSATDAYQPVERKLGITRSVIEVLAECAHPFSLVTKSSGIERDLDLVAPMARARPGGGLRLGHLARPGARAHPRAARGGAAPPAAHDRGAGARRRAGRRQRLADHPVHQRAGDRAHPRGRRARPARARRSASCCACRGR